MSYNNNDTFIQIISYNTKDIHSETSTPWSLATPALYSTQNLRLKCGNRLSPHLSSVCPGECRNYILRRTYVHDRRFEWPRGLRRGSAAARLLGLWVRLPPIAWLTVFGQKDFSASGWSLVQRSPTYSGVSECDRESSAMTRPWLTGTVTPW